MKILVVTLSIFVAGCVPWPHRANLTPSVAGVLLAEGNPKVDSPLRIVASDPGNKDAPCDGKSHEFKTTNEGRFYGPPVRTFRFFMVIMGHTLFPWAVCVKQDGVWTPLYQEKTYTLGNTGPWFLVEMSCHDVACETKKNLQPTPELIESLGERNE
ncbi:MAG: hypothetical protein BVN28_08510 [Nitrospira sp. ST-bin4]|jgi:hypothetical protein|nr:MAG: hypothetical protein BVN28_08510 [Nitrospira sp. ST-bin4]